jgi:hypothetical protein
MTTTILLTNDVHQTKVRLRAKNRGTHLELTPSQARRSRSTLCPAECKCGDDGLGTRGMDLDALIYPDGFVEIFSL